MRKGTFQSSSKALQPLYGSDLIVGMMRAFDIEYVAVNSGASFRWLHESLINYGGNVNPEIITCCHEETCVALAHGYAKAKGKPMAAVVHNIVGLQHASMAIFNAFCDRAPVIVLGGTGPMDLTKRRSWDWKHTALVQGNQVRDYVKWDDQPYTVSSIPESFVRGYRVATTEPQGPVYICYGADIQADVMPNGIPIPDIRRYAPAAPAQADSEAIRQAAEWLMEAKSPVIVADYVGKTPQACQSLIELAELLAIPVLDMMGRYNFPSDHPLDLTGAESEVLAQADLILGLEVKELFAALHIRDPHTGLSSPIVSPGARIIHISLWDQSIRSWATDIQRLCPVDLNIPADTTVALPHLVSLCREKLGEDEAKREQRRRRFTAIQDRHESLRRQWKARAVETRNESPISTAVLASEIWGAIKDDDWVLVNGDLEGWARKIWDLNRPGQFLGSSAGGGLGYGIGASLGAALALKERGALCIDLQPDGDLLYAATALWTAAHHRVPLLIIMFNNRCYHNSGAHVVDVANERERSVDRSHIGTRLEHPTVDFARLAQSMGVYGEGPIELPDHIAPALQRALRVVKERRAPALVDVVCQCR